jgi:hypothetical protein
VILLVCKFGRDRIELAMRENELAEQARLQKEQPSLEVVK